MQPTSTPPASNPTPGPVDCEPYRRRLLAYFTRRLRRLPRTFRTSDLPAELVQETLCRALTAKINSSLDVWPYLCGIASHVLSDLLRARAAEHLVPDPWVFYNSGDLSSSVNDNEVDTTLAIVATWSDRQTVDVRGFVKGRCLDGQSQSAVAQTLGLSRRQVINRERRVRKAIAKYLLNNGVVWRTPRRRDGM
jgi:DNA-directed RNA polymerase specialized sigma24 family protein